MNDKLVICPKWKECSYGGNCYDAKPHRRSSECKIIKLEDTGYAYSCPACVPCNENGEVIK